MDTDHEMNTYSLCDTQIKLRKKIITMVDDYMVSAMHADSTTVLAMIADEDRDETNDGFGMLHERISEIDGYENRGSISALAIRNGVTHLWCID